jgi:hypothetical protein
MKVIPIMQMLETEYKIQFTDEQKNSFMEFVKNEKVDLDRLHLKLLGSYESYQSAITSEITVKTSHITPMIDFDRVIWSLVPQRFPVNTSIGFKNGARMFEYKDSYSGTVSNEANIVIVKRTEFNTVLNSFIDDYYLYIYNPALETVADGIRFV